MPTKPIILDGRTLEGGGQLLRLALCLSALTSIPVRIHSIRGNRSGGGGLKAQHLACVNWLAHACQARDEGAEKGAKDLLFVPGGPAGGGGAEELSPAFTKRRVEEEKREVYEAKLEIKTAGSTGLALQAILPFILFTAFPSPLPVRLTLSGGTNVSQSPSYEYITQVLLPTLETIGFPRMEAKLGKRGWSQGGSSIGNFTLEIPARPTVVLPAFELVPPSPRRSPSENSTEAPAPRLKINHVHATLLAPSTCHDHFLPSLKKELKSHFPYPTYPSFTEAHGNLTIEVEDSRHTKRMYLLLVATVSYPLPPPSPSPGAEQPSKRTFKLGRDWLYNLKLPQKSTHSPHSAAVEQMVEKVCADLAGEVESGACVDEHMRDHLVVFEALARGRSEVFGGREGGGKGELREASLHARTAEWVAEQMLGSRGVEFDGVGGCQGVGFLDADAEDAMLGSRMGELDLG